MEEVKLNKIKLDKLAIQTSRVSYLENRLSTGVFFNLNYIKSLEERGLYQKAIRTKKSDRDLTYIKIELIDLVKNRLVTLLLSSELAAIELYEDNIIRLYENYYKVDKTQLSNYYINCTLSGRVSDRRLHENIFRPERSTELRLHH